MNTIRRKIILNKATQTENDKHGMYSCYVNISIKIKDNFATICRPRESRKQVWFMTATRISLGRGVRRGFLSGLRVGRYGNVSNQVGGGREGEY